MDGAPHDPRFAWAEVDRPRASARARLLFPVVLTLLVQVPAAVFLAIVFRGDGALLTLALAVAGPLALLGARRFPGPTVAVVSALAAVDFAVGSGLPSPYARGDSSSGLLGISSGSSRISIAATPPLPCWSVSCRANRPPVPAQPLTRPCRTPPRAPLDRYTGPPANAPSADGYTVSLQSLTKE